MSDTVETVVGDVLRVLVVGDSASIEAAATALSTAEDPVSLVRERTVPAARDRLAETDVHCLVCAFGERTSHSSVDDRSTLAQLHEDSEVPIVALAAESAIEGALTAGAVDVVSPELIDRLLPTRVRNAAERYRLATASTDHRFRSVLDATTDVVWVVDETGAIEYVNAAVDDRMGYTPAELERTTLFRLVHPDDRAEARQLLATAAEGPLGTTERDSLRIGHADGTWHVADLSVVNRLADPAVGGLVVTVTEPEAGVGAAPLADAIDRLDAAFFTVGPQWELTFANEAARRLFLRSDRSVGSAETTDRADRPGVNADRGDSPGTVTPERGTVLWELLPAALRGEFADRLREAAATNEPVSFETTINGDDRLAVTAFPAETGLSVMARVTDDATIADRDRLDRFEAIVDAFDDGIAVLDGTTITYANRALFDIAEIDPLVGRDIGSLVDDDLAAAIGERAASPLVRWMEPLTGTIDPDGVERPIEVSVMPLGPADTQRACCVIRDRRGTPAEALSMVTEIARDLAQTDAEAAVSAATVDAIRSYTAADVAVWYRRDDAVVRPMAVATATPGSDPELPAIDRRGEPFSDVFDADEVTVADRDDVEPVSSRAGIRAERVLTVPIGDDDVLLATSTDPMGFATVDREPIETAAAIAALALATHRAARHTRVLEREHAALETAVEHADAARALETELFDGESRSAVERRLVEGVVSLADAIELAWIGDAPVGSDVVTPRTWAGRDGSFLESIAIPVDAGDGEPAGRTAASRDPTLVESIDRDSSQEWQRLAADRGFRSALSVPLQYDEFWYGTLTVYADRPAAFDDRLQTLCGHLATVASYVRTAIERKRALLSDDITELEVTVPTGADPVTALAHRLGSRVDVRTVVPRSSGGTTVYGTIADSEASTIRAAVDEIDGVEDCRIVGEPTGAVLVELRCTDDSIAELLADRGGVLRSIEPAGNRSRLVVEVPNTTDVRSFVEVLDRTVSGTELTARREHDRTTPHGRSFEAELRAQLSERQLRTLETAYYSGFFEWPRESTGEEVAQSLGVSQPTFSRHFRLAQQKLFSLLFDELDAFPADDS